MAEVKKTNVERLPIPPVPNSEQRKIGDLSKKIEETLGELSGTAAESTRTVAKRRLAGIFEQLNRSVYSLFKLTPEEIDIIETAQGDVIAQGR